MTRTPAENIRLLTNMDPSIHIYLSNSANILFRRAFPNALPMEAASMDLLRKFGDEVEAIIVSCDDTKLDQAIAAKVGEWKQVQPEQRVFQFAVLPSNIRPRLLVSRESKFAFSFGLKSYVPGKGFSRVLQRILRLLGPSSIPSRYILSLKGNRESTFWIDALFEATGLSGQLCSLITGGEGDTNTAVVVLKSPEESVYAKIAISEIAKQNVKNESYWLEKLALHDLNEFRVPQLKYFGIFGDTFISATKSIGEKLVQVKKPQAQLIQAIVRLNNIEQRTLPILQTAQAVCISEWMQRDYDDSIIALKPNWEILCSELALVNVPVGVGHGDFTPWNILQNREKTLFLLDWEWATKDAAPMDDLAHYLVQSHLTLNQKSPWSQQAVQIMKDYLRLVNIEERLWKPFLNLHLVYWILFETIVGKKKQSSLKAYYNLLQQ